MSRVFGLSLLNSVYSPLSTLVVQRRLIITTKLSTLPTKKAARRKPSGFSFS